MQIENTLAERGARYGDFTEHARITQNIKAAMQDSPNWASLPPMMKEALDMVAHKIGRILNGDPNYADSWHDMAGYARLVEERIAGGIKGEPLPSLKDDLLEMLEIAEVVDVLDDVETGGADAS